MASSVAKALGQLVDVANGEHSDPDGALTEAQEATRTLRQVGGWSHLQDEDVSAVSLTRALGDILKQPEDAGLRSLAAAVYSSLLTVKDAPVSRLWD